MKLEKAIGIEEIKKLIPHREPFLLIEGLENISPHESATGIKDVSLSEYYFQGHFPEKAIMPGVLIIEAMAQAGGVLVIESMPEKMHGQSVYFLGMDKVRFRKPVVPGDQIIFEVKILKIRSKAVKLSGKASVDKTLVAEAEILASFGDD